MAKTKMVINAKKELSTGGFMIMFQISHKTETVRVTTGVKVAKENWDKVNGLVIGGKKGDPLSLSKNATLTKMKNECDIKILQNKDRIDKISNIKVLKAFLLGDVDPLDTDFFRYIDKRIAEIRSQGRESTVKIYSSLRSKVLSFTVIPELDMKNINLRWLEKFETYCKSPVAEGEKRKQMSGNGVAGYMTYLRIILNNAIDDELIENYPFRKYKIKRTATSHRDLNMDEVRRIRDHQSENKKLQLSTDIWWLSFCLSGISPKDLFWRTHEDVKAGRLEFARFKTTTPYSIKIQPEAEPILEKYKGEKYLLQFADTAEGRGKVRKAHSRKSTWQWKDANAFNKTVNRGLKTVQSDLKINPDLDLTLYTARHSVATLLGEQDVSLDHIALVMGHVQAGLEVTSIYTNKSFLKADQAMRKLLDAVASAPVSPVADPTGDPSAET